MIKPLVVLAEADSIGGLFADFAPDAVEVLVGVGQLASAEAMPRLRQARDTLARRARRAHARAARQIMTPPA